MYEGFSFTKNRIALADEITDADSRGTSGTVYGNQATKWIGDLSEGAQKRLVFLSAVNENVPNVGAQFVARYISLPDSDDTITVTQSEGISSDLSNTDYNEPEAVYITPVNKYVNSVIGYTAEHKNVDDISQRQMETFSYSFSDNVDKYIATALAGATEMSNTVRGAALIYAGGKKADDQITESDTFSLSLLNEAKNRLEKKDAFYWNSEVLTKSALKKNTWKNEKDDPFVLVIGHDQDKAFLESSQFRDASEYGSNEVLLNGEIGKLFGVRIVISDNIPTTDAGDAAWDTTTNSDVDLARCFLMKGTAAYIFVWGKEPTFEKMPSPTRLGTILRLWGMYAGSVYHADAIVKIDCATNISVY